MTSFLAPHCFIIGTARHNPSWWCAVAVHVRWLESVAKNDEHPCAFDDAARSRGIDDHQRLVAAAREGKLFFFLDGTDGQVSASEEERGIGAVLSLSS
mmetsp:Transcript_11431/g.32798  ORF Transcript_11431/g.32798 Transcript_11431/m.32798 type:complete len:98 (-) Transcript_11431:59-352(-)